LQKLLLPYFYNCSSKEAIIRIFGIQFNEIDMFEFYKFFGNEYLKFYILILWFHFNFDDPNEYEYKEKGSGVGWNAFKFQNYHFKQINEQLRFEPHLTDYDFEQYNLLIDKQPPPYIYLLCTNHIQLLGIKDFENFINLGAKKWYPNFKKLKIKPGFRDFKFENVVRNFLLALGWKIHKQVNAQDNIKESEKCNNKIDEYIEKGSEQLYKRLENNEEFPENFTADQFLYVFLVCNKIDLFKNYLSDLVLKFGYKIKEY